MQKGKAFKRPPNTHKKKSRFGIRVKDRRNLGLTKGAEQCFIFGTVCVGEQLAWQDLFFGSSLDPSSP